jgi:hypothetical protein
MLTVGRKQLSPGLYDYSVSGGAGLIRSVCGGRRILKKYSKNCLAIHTPSYINILWVEVPAI